MAKSEADLAFERRRRLVRKKSHLCAKCGKQDERTLAGRYYCTRCNESKNKYARTHRKVLTPEERELKRRKEREMYQALRAKGLCVSCHTQPADEGYVTCTECREKIKDRQRRARERRKGNAKKEPN